MNESYQLHYGGENHGPYTLGQIRSMCAAGLVTVDAVFLDEAANVWKPLVELEAGGGFASKSKDAFASMPAPPAIPHASGRQVARQRPWRRLFARTLDKTLLVIPFWAVMWLTLPYTYRVFFSTDFRSWVTFSSLYFPYMFLVMVSEPFFLSRWGTTPGKWMLGLSVRRRDGGRLSFNMGFRRLLRLLPYAYIPVFFVVTYGISYFKLKKNGVTPWDEKAGSEVDCQRKIRWVCIIGVWVLYSVSLHPFISHGAHGGTPASQDEEAALDPDYKAAMAALDDEAYPASLDSAKKAVARFPQSELAQTCLAMALTWNDNYEDAQAAINKAIKLAPDSAIAWRVLADINALRGYPDEAEKNFRKSMDMDAANPAVWLEIAAKLYIPQYRMEEAAEATGRALHLLQAPASHDRGPEEWSEWQEWGSVGRNYMSLERPADAAAAYEHAVKLKPAIGSLWTGLGSAYFGLKRYADALAPLERAVKLSPDDEHAWYWLGADYSLLNRDKESAEAASRAVKLNPKDDEAWFTLGAAYLSLNQTADEVTALETATRLSPDRDDPRWTFLGKAYEALGRPDDAKAAYQSQEEAQTRVARKEWQHDAEKKYPALKDAGSALRQMADKIEADAQKPGSPIHMIVGEPNEAMLVADLAARRVGVTPVPAPAVSNDPADWLQVDAGPNAGFAYALPRDWRLGYLPGLESQVAFGRRQDMNPGNINFSVFNASYYDLTAFDMYRFMKEMVPIYAKMGLTDVKFLGHSAFQTSLQQAGVRIVAQAMRQDGRPVRQIMYMFERKDGAKVVATCSAIDIGDTYDPVFDSILKTFRVTK